MYFTLITFWKCKKVLFNALDHIYQLLQVDQIGKPEPAVFTYCRMSLIVSNWKRHTVHQDESVVSPAGLWADTEPR